MGVDLRPYISDDWPNQGQSVSNPDPDWAYDCQLECLKITARDYGYGTPYNDQTLRRLGEPVTGNSGMLFPTVMNDVAANAFPGLRAIMTIQGSSADTLRANISKGYMQHVALWCDTNAWVPPQGPRTYSHCCRCVADTGTGFVFQNPEPHPDFFLTDAQVNELNDGEGILVFQKSLVPKPAIISPLGGGMGAVAFTFRPSNWGTYIDQCLISDNGSHNVLHQWGVDTEHLYEENLGGWADERFGVSCGWAPDGVTFIVQCVGSDGYVWRNWWNGTQWSGFGHISTVDGNAVHPLAPPQATAGPQGEKGDPGAPGTTLDQATVDAMVKASVEADVAPAIAPAVQAALDPKAIAAAIEAAMKSFTGV